MSVNIKKTGIVQASGEIGANLVIGGKKDIGPNSTYNIGNFILSGELTAGQKFTVTIKGTIGADKKFGLWLGGGYNLQGYFTDRGDGTFTLTFTSPSSISGDGRRDRINIYAYPSSNTNQSSMNWIKLESGTIPTDWIPNINDEDFVGNTSGFNEQSGNAQITKGYINATDFIEI